MIDRLIEKIDELGAPIVVGLDPTPEMLPEALLAAAVSEYGATPAAMGAAFLRFNKEIIDCIYDVVPAVKPQVAMYERFGAEGIRAYIETCAYAKEKGLLVIGDVKRGDISSTAEAYGAHIGGSVVDGPEHDLWHADAVTVNPYLGTDGIRPFTDVCREKDKMIFVLVKTSNPSSSELQDLVREGGEPLYVKVASLTEQWGAALVGAHGYSKVGAVVGATHPEEGAMLRARFPKLFFLVPGYGAQGATAADLRGFFDTDGRGCIVNSSRGITAAWKKEAPGCPVGDAARKAALEMRSALNER